MENQADPVEKKTEEAYKLPRPLKKGDRVLIYDIDKNAIVVTPPDKSGMTEVQAGIIKTRVPVKNLRLLKDDTVHTTATNKGGPVRKPRNVTKELSRNNIRTEVDLRGMTADEAILELDRFIDGAVLSGVNMISIIHGKGTGVLRSAVNQRLRSHPNIKTYRLGVYGEGENGVTIAELK
jgi:DNA mismatch repair protein MutS2